MLFALMLQPINCGLFLFRNTLCCLCETGKLTPGRTLLELSYTIQYRPVVDAADVKEEDGDSYPAAFAFTTVVCINTDGGRGTCSGDSGGPLLSEPDRRQVGITSYGGNQCTTEVPACFTDVAMFNDWIDQQTVD